MNKDWTICLNTHVEKCFGCECAAICGRGSAMIDSYKYNTEEEDETV